MLLWQPIATATCFEETRQPSPLPSWCAMARFLLL